MLHLGPVQLPLKANSFIAAAISFLYMRRIRTNTNYVLIVILLVGLGLSWNIEITAPGIPSLGDGEGKGEVDTTIVAVGDILLSRHVGAQIDEAGNPSLPFEKLQSILSSADITFGNLECPLSDSNIPIREGLIFRCLTKYVPGLVNAGFDVLSTANNHAMDQGIKGLEFTIDHLLAQGILPVGTFKQSAFTNSIELVNGILRKNGLKFGFLAYSYSAFNDGKNTSHPQIATMDIENLQSQISILKSRGAAVIIVSMHAGTEYTRTPNQIQVNFAHAAIDAGADVVIGHHPHWIQPIEVYQGKPIFYSLGNFVFDQEWSQETKEGLIVKLNIKNKELKNAELIPVIIESFCCPRLADVEEKKNILKKIGLATDKIKF